MRSPKLSTKWMRRKARAQWSAVVRRHRQLFAEQLEDRRLLATAADDQYFVDVGGVRTVEGLGTWSNDLLRWTPKIGR
jgi:hypothetical protein